LIEQLKDHHNGKLIPRDVIHGSSPIFLHALESISNPSAKALQDFPLMTKSLEQVFNLSEDKTPKFIDLTVTFVRKDDPKMEIVKNTPPIRIYFMSFFFDSDSY
jgi:hypothetical protein